MPDPFNFNSIVQVLGYSHGQSPVSKLPLEILAEVFKYLVLSPPARGPSCPHPHLAWIPVTHVNRAWRTAALQFPRLWTNIVSHPAQWANEMIKRSKSVPFTFSNIHDLLPRVDQRPILTLALAHASRLEALSLCLTPSFGNEEVSRHLASATPFLRSLQIDNGCNPHYSGDITLGDSPRLQHISLNAALISPKSAPLNAVVSLQLEQVAPNLEELLLVLEGMQNLQNILLIGISDVRGTSTTKVINLPRLNRIELVCSVAGLQLFRHIVAPRINNVDVTCDYEASPDPQTDLIPLYSFLGLKHDVKFQTQELSIEFEGPAITRLNLLSTPLSSASTARPTPISLTYAEVEMNMTNVCESLPLQALHRLEIKRVSNSCDVCPSDDDWPTPNAWISLFGHLETVEKISINSADCILPLTIRDGEDDTLPFPSLRHIAIEGVDFTVDDSFGYLLQYVGDRAERREPLDELELLVTVDDFNGGRLKMPLVSNQQVGWLKRYVNTLILKN